MQQRKHIDQDQWSDFLSQVLLFRSPLQDSRLGA
jgi:hypothetical protein